MSRNILLLLALISPIQSIGQCCSPGNPVGGSSNLGVMDDGTWKILAHYRHSYSGEYYEGTQPVDPYFVESGYYDYLGILVSHAVSTRITVDLESGYFLCKAQNYVNGIIPEKKKGYGLSFLSITPKINLLKKNSWEISTGLGLRIPLGPYNRKFDGAIAELDIQPSTGGIGYIHTLFISKEYQEKHLRFFLYNRIEINKPNPLQYEYGNLYSTSAFASYSLSIRWDVILQFRGEIRRMDRRPGQLPPYKMERIPVSGSEKIFVSPQLNFNLNQSSYFSAVIDYPIYQNYNRQQLANSYAFTVVFAKKIKDI